MANGLLKKNALFPRGKIFDRLLNLKDRFPWLIITIYLILVAASITFILPLFFNNHISSEQLNLRLQGTFFSLTMALIVHAWLTAGIRKTFILLLQGTSGNENSFKSIGFEYLTAGISAFLTSIGFIICIICLKSVTPVLLSSVFMLPIWIYWAISGWKFMSKNDKTVVN